MRTATLSGRSANVILVACTFLAGVSQAAERRFERVDGVVDSVFAPHTSWISLASMQHQQSIDSAEFGVPVSLCGSVCGGGCFDDFCTRPTLTNGFGGLQTCLAEQGIAYDAQLTQFGQRVTTGGAALESAYGGKLDQFLILDSSKLGLWEGAQLIMHAETRYGDDVILDAAGLAPVNANMLYPSLENQTAVTGLILQQALSDDWAVSIGKFNGFDLLSMLYPQTGRGIDGFMNASMFLPLTFARTMPLSFMGVSLIKMQEGKIQGSLTVYDNQNVSTTSGLDNLFENGASLMGMWRIFTNLGELPGSHALMGTWCSGDYTSLDPTGWTFNPVVGLVAPEESTSWSLQYIAEQTFWVDDRNPERSIGLLSQWGYADPETCPFEWIGNVAVQATGVIPGRAMDKVGAGYFYSGLSGDFKSLVSPLVAIDDLQGVEVYYNAAVTPWFRLTGDLQVVSPGIQANDTAVVLALRAWLHL